MEVERDFCLEFEGFNIFLGRSYLKRKRKDRKFVVVAVTNTMQRWSSS